MNSDKFFQTYQATDRKDRNKRKQRDLTMTEPTQTKTDKQDGPLVLPVLLTAFGIWTAVFPIFLPDWGMFPVNPMHWFFIVSALTAGALFVVIRLTGSPSGTTGKGEA